MPRRTRPLTTTEIRNAKPDDFPLYDGHGLYLIRAASGELLWRLKYYRPDGRENRMGLGNLREVTLAQARTAAMEARALIRQGIDPVGDRRARKAEARRETEASFPRAAEAWLAKKRSTVAPETYRKAAYVVNTYLVPKLRRESIATLGSREANAAIDAIVAVAPSLARKARQYLNGIVDEAIHAGLRDDGRRLVLRNQVRGARDKGHIPAATKLKDVRSLVRAIEALESPVVRGALQLAMYTAVRPGTVASARWSEIDLDDAEWHIDGARMKTGHDHIVPLPRQAVSVLRAMQDLSDGRLFVFPPLARQKTPHLHRDTLSKALRMMGFQGLHSTHGFRGMLRTVARERLNIDPDVLEAQLAHAKKGEVQAAYDRTTFDQARRDAMQAWADFLTSLSQDSA